MISIYCEKHRKENDEAYKAFMEENPELDFSKSGTRVLFIATKEVESNDCPDCSLVGLNKSGRIGKLDSPDDWLFSQSEGR